MSKEYILHTGKKCVCKKKGVALILCLSVLIVLSSLGTVIMSRSISESRSARRYMLSTQAFWVAEAGYQRGAWELNHGDGTWSGWSDDGSGNKTLTAALGSIGEYTVQINNPSGVNPTVTATGYTPSIADTNAIQRGVVITLGQSSNPIFAYAGFGKTLVVMSGNAETDSYDSGSGAYGGANIASNGDVGTNAESEGAISLSGNATVNGDARTGEGGTVSTSGGAAVNGSITDDADEDFPSVVIPSELSGLASGGSLSLSGHSTQTLTTGDYKFSDITISGQATLIIQGEVRIYLTGSFSTSGNGYVQNDGKVKFYTDGEFDISGNGIINNSNLPENCLIYSTYSGSNNGVKISGNGDLYAGIYAPDTEVKITGNGDVYGSLIGNSFKVSGNGDIHYDEALINVGTDISTNYVCQDWQEQANPYQLVP